MDSPPISAEVARLLTVAVESVERLEILLAMRLQPAKSFTAKTLRSRLSLNGSASATDTHLALLCGRGFLAVTIANDLVYSYKPISAAIEEQVTEIAQLWATRRADVVSLLREKRSVDPARAFAEAFRFRKSGDDDG